MNVGVIAGNPKPDSRTLAAAKMVAESIGAGVPVTVIDVVKLGAGLLGFGSPEITEAIEAVQSLEVAVFASPTYKASICGILKCFLDQFPSNGLSGVVAVPLMLGAGPGHLLAPELTLKPVLVELGATCPTRALYLLDTNSADPSVIAPWLETASGQIKASVGA
jgi:FMN reductase